MKILNCPENSRIFLKKIFFDFSRFCLCFVFLLIVFTPILEVFLRTFTEQAYTPGYLITHPIRHYALKPDFTGKTYGTEFYINLDGIRDDEKVISIREEDYRIAVFGDSMAFGQGIPLEKTFAKRTEYLLNRGRGAESRIPSGDNRHYRVINFAVPGYNFATQVAYLKEVYNRFKPQLLIFAFTIQQQTISATSSSVNQLRWLRDFKDLLRTQYSYTYFSRRFYALREKDQSPEDLEINKTMDHYRDDYPGWTECQAALHELADFSRANHIPLVMAIIGDEGTISPTRQADPLNPVFEKFQNVLADAGITHAIFLDDALRSYSNRPAEIKLGGNDDHYSALAHELTGDHLYHYLEQNYLLLKGSVL